jgi:hypothetical protein
LKEGPQDASPTTSGTGPFVPWTIRLGRGIQFDETVRMLPRLKILSSKYNDAKGED